jgi:hypothetical protein
LGSLNGRWNCRSRTTSPSGWSPHQGNSPGPAPLTT